MRVRNAITAAVKKECNASNQRFSSCRQIDTELSITDCIIQFKLPVEFKTNKITNRRPQQQRQPFLVQMRTLARIYCPGLIRDIRTIDKNGRYFVQ